MLLGTLGPSLLVNMSAGKGIYRAGHGSKDLQSQTGKGVIKAGYQNEPRFTGVYSRVNLPEKYRMGHM